MNNEETKTEITKLPTIKVELVKFWATPWLAAGLFTLGCMFTDGATFLVGEPWWYQVIVCIGTIMAWPFLWGLHLGGGL